MKRLFILTTFTALLTFLFTQSATATSSGAAIFVTSRTDAPDSNPGDGFCDDGNGDCGLRAAVMEANATAGADEIVIFVAGTTQFNISTQINITDDVTITGADPAITRLDGGDQARLFDVTSASLTLENMTLRNANGGITNGGAIRTNNDSNNRVVLLNMVVKDNQATNGGGMFVLGNLTIQNSLIENNQATFDGGGISANLSRRTTIVGNTIIRNNTAGSDAGGISATNLLMTNSAVHNNSAAGSAGGIRLSSSTGTHSLTQVTVSSNSADSGGGINMGSGTLKMSNVTITNNEARSNDGGGIKTIGTVTVRNSIIAGNYAGHPDCHGGTWISEGYNLVGLVTAACSWAGDTGNDLFATALPAINPRLGPLQFNDHDNDGNDDETPTHEPNEDSPAVNGANPAGCFQIGSALPFPMTNDQRGAARSQQGHCDIGSAESPHETPVSPTAVAISEQLSVSSYQWQGVAVVTLVLILLTAQPIWLHMSDGKSVKGG